MSTYSQKVASSLKANSIVPDAVYTAPKERFPNSFSAINSGVSEEDGLATLTFKSIEYTQYAEQLELMRDVMFENKPKELSRINDKPFKGQELLERLQKDVETLKADSGSETHQSITQLNSTLNELISNRQPIDQIGKQIFEEYKRNSNGTDFVINLSPYSKTAVDVKDNRVERMEDVPGLDTSAYEKPAVAEASDVNMGSFDEAQAMQPNMDIAHTQFAESTEEVPSIYGGYQNLQGNSEGF